MTILFYNVANKNKIVLFHLPSYYTHLIQPLDVGVFKFFKYYHIDGIDKTVRLGDDKFGKLEFLSIF